MHCDSLQYSRLDPVEVSVTITHCFRQRTFLFAHHWATEFGVEAKPVVWFRHLRSLSGSVLLHVWWGLPAFPGCMEHYFSLVQVLHPSSASWSPHSHKQLAENLQKHNHTFFTWIVQFWKLERIVPFETHWWINEDGVVAYLRCISFWSCWSLHRWHRLIAIVMQSQSHKIIFIFPRSSKEACERSAGDKHQTYPSKKIVK